MTVGLGSVTGILDGSLQIQTRGSRSIQRAPLVLANILAPVIVSLLGQGLTDLVLSDGVLVLSGILAEQSASVLLAAQEHGLELIEKRQLGDWVALVLKHVNI